MGRQRGYSVRSLIVAAVMTPIAGKMSDLYGKKKVLLVLLTMYAAGIATGGFADNISFLLASRIIQGVGFTRIQQTFSLLRDTFPPARACDRRRSVSIYVHSAGSVVGLLAGATIIQRLWMAFYFLLHSSIPADSDIYDCQIRKRKQRAINGSCPYSRKYG